MPKSILSAATLFCGLFYSALVLGFDYLQTLPEEPLSSKENPQTSNKIKLGKKLFFDVKLSKNKSHSCNYCHNLFTGGDDDRAFSMTPDGQTTHRSAPGLWNIGLQTVLYWDGRATSLEEQARDHFKDPIIMGLPTESEILQRLANDDDYKNMFKNSFAGAQEITFDNLIKALSSFQRALLAPNSAFDRYLNGDKQALSAAARKGIEDFNNAGCLACHFGVNFAGPAPGPAMGMGDGFYELFPNHLGSIYDELYDLKSDLGRYAYSKNSADKYLWRVPPLRNIALTAPYFHNGSAKSLREAVRTMARVQFKKNLTEEQINNIVAFLNSLTGELPAVLRED